MSEQNLVDWKVEMTLRIAEGSRPEKWAVQVVTACLEDGEEVIDYNFTLVEDVVDYKKDLIAALEQIKTYSDNVLIIDDLIINTLLMKS
jgi:hypothetical protein